MREKGGGKGPAETPPPEGRTIGPYLPELVAKEDESILGKGEGGKARLLLRHKNKKKESFRLAARFHRRQGKDVRIRGKERGVTDIHYHFLWGRKKLTFRLPQIACCWGRGKLLGRRGRGEKKGGLSLCSRKRKRRRGKGVSNGFYGLCKGLLGKKKKKRGREGSHSP